MNILTKTNQLFMSFLLASLLCACSASPEDYGRDIAAKECECDLLRVDLDTKNVEDLKANRFRTQLELVTETYPGKFAADSTAHEECRAELKKLEDEAPLKFVQEDERKTLKNSYRAHIEEGRKEISERRRAYSSVEKEFGDLMRALPQQ